MSVKVATKKKKSPVVKKKYSEFDLIKDSTGSFGFIVSKEKVDLERTPENKKEFGRDKGNDDPYKGK